MKIRYRRAWIGVLCITGVFWAMACSSSDDKADDSPDGGDPGSKDGGTPSGDSGNGGEGPIAKFGSVFLFNSKYTISGNDYATHSASAFFYDATSTGGGSGSKCETTKEGSCTLTVCPLANPDAGDSGTKPPKYVHAGTIDISGAAIAPAIKLQPKADATYPSVSGQTSIWAGGEDIRIRAAGNADAVAAFDDTLKAPSLIKVSAPSWAASAYGPKIPRSRDLDVAWSSIGAVSGQVGTVLSAQGGGKSYNLSCTQPVADLKTKIPASLIGKLPAGAGSFYVSTSETSTQKAGDWRVSLSLVTNATREGGVASGQATFE